MEVAFFSQPFWPVVVCIVVDKQGKIGEERDDFLAQGSSEIEADANCLVKFCSDLFRYLKKLATLSGYAEELKAGFSPGGEKNGKEEKIWLSVDA